MAWKYIIIVYQLWSQGASEGISLNPLDLILPRKILVELIVSFKHLGKWPNYFYNMALGSSNFTYIGSHLRHISVSRM